MSDWTAIPDLIEEFNLKSRPYDLEGLKAEVRNKLIENHPDKNKNSPESNEVSARLNAAIQFLENQSNALVPISVLTNVVAEITKNTLSIKGLDRESIAKEAVREAQEIYRHKHKLPKISLGAISSVITFMFLFPQQFIKHPYLADIK